MAVRGPLLVCGVGRSGTSLVQAMLDSHPAIGFCPETHFFRHYLVPRFRRWRLERQSPASLERRFADDRYLGRQSVAPDELVAMAGSRDDGTDLTRTYWNMLCRECGGGNKSVIGDKDPRSIEYLSAYWRQFPDAFVLHVVRDPRDVLVSKKQARWSKGRPPLLHIFINAVQLELGRKAGEPGREAGRYRELVYEQLLQAPEAEMRGLCQWLGLAYDPAMLDFAESARQLVTDEEMSWKKETLGPLLERNVGKWRQMLSAREVALTELVCTQAFTAGGYERSGALYEMASTQRLVVRFQALVMRALKPVYRFVRLRLGQ